MNSIDLKVLSTALEWVGDGRRVTLGTVVRTWGSSPRPPGSMMALREDGQLVGSVSGGCIEDDLIYRLSQADPVFAGPGVTTYGEQAEEGRRFGLPCGGTVEVILEPAGDGAWLVQLLEAIRARRGVERRLDLQTGEVTLADSGEADRVEFDGRCLRAVYAPRERLLIVGAGQLSRCVAGMAVMLDMDVTVCDPRPEYHEGWEALEGVVLATRLPDEVVSVMQPGPRDAVLALTHDPKLDDLALMEALRSPAFFVGALGSRRTNAARRERLLEFDVTPEQLEHLQGPVGLPIGAKTPAEIAVSILAQLVEFRRRPG
jgi:xanthine dehydrogenase accessory factor